MTPRPLADFQALYAEHGLRIYRFCLRLCGSVADAEDLTQDVFLAAFQGRTRFEGRSSVQTWLYCHTSTTTVGGTERAEANLIHF